MLAHVLFDGEWVGSNDTLNAELSIYGRLNVLGQEDCATDGMSSSYACIRFNLVALLDRIIPRSEVWNKQKKTTLQIIHIDQTVAALFQAFNV